MKRRGKTRSKLMAGATRGNYITKVDLVRSFA